jgi:hypothetical protein
MQDTVVRRGWNAVDVALAAASALTFVYAWLYYPISQGHRGDFLGALSHRDDGSRFWNGEGIGYGPIFAFYDLILRPLHDLAALRIMYVINLGFLAATLIILVRTLLPAPRTRRETLLALFVWFSFYPLAQLIRQDDVEITELFFLSLFLSYTARRRFTGAGVALGLAAATKLIPIFLLPYLAWRRQWRTIAYALVTFALAIVAIAALKSFNPLLAITSWGESGAAKWPTEWNNNQALSGFCWRLFSTATFQSDITASYPHVNNRGAATMLSLAASLAAVVTTVALFFWRQGIWPRRPVEPDVEITEIAIVLTVLLLALPHSHTHYFGLIVWIYFIALRAVTRRDPPLPARTQWLFVASFLLAGMLMPLRLADPIIRRRLPVSLVELWKLYSLPMFGIILAAIALFGVQRALLRRTSPDGA